MAFFYWPSARGLALFALLALIANAAWAGADVAGWTGTFYLALFIYLGFSIYDAGFTPARKRSWVLLIIVWVLLEATAFLAYVVPMGQVAFWLAGVVPANLITPLMSTFTSGWLVPILGFAALLFDAAIWHLTGGTRNGLVDIILLVARAIVAGLLVGWLFGLLVPAPATGASLSILPPWYGLPAYALLRAVPDKLGGILLVLAAMLVLLPWPWIMHKRPSWRGLWLLCCLFMVAVWATLGYLGAQPPEGTALPALLLATLHFLFFLILPFLARR